MHPSRRSLSPRRPSTAAVSPSKNINPDLFARTRDPGRVVSVLATRATLFLLLALLVVRRASHFFVFLSFVSPSFVFPECPAFSAAAAFAYLRRTVASYTLAHVFSLFFPLVSLFGVLLRVPPSATSPYSSTFFVVFCSLFRSLFFSQPFRGVFLVALPTVRVYFGVLCHATFMPRDDASSPSSLFAPWSPRRSRALYRYIATLVVSVVSLYEYIRSTRRLSPLLTPNDVMPTPHAAAPSFLLVFLVHGAAGESCGVRAVFSFAPIPALRPLCAESSPVLGVSRRRYSPTSDSRRTHVCTRMTSLCIVSDFCFLCTRIRRIVGSETGRGGGARVARIPA